MKKLLISGTMSGSGKTTVSSILMSALENVAPFKIGPDYIDPGYHELFTGNRSYNLDAFMHDAQTLKNIFEINSIGKDISIVEGVMGLYDGLGHEKDNCSTAHVARILDIPVILVVNAKGISTSIAAEILGFKLFDENVRIKGVILNNVSSEKLYLNLKKAIERYTGIECVGYIPRDERLSSESRHLGLKQASEITSSKEIQERREIFKKVGTKSLNLDRIMEIANNFETDVKIEDFKGIGKLKDKYVGKKIAVAKDGAFSFYYNSNMDLIRYCGFEIVEFSPVKDAKVPEDVFLIYLGGGYPELYAKELSENRSMMESIRDAHAKGVKIYAECGGFIYLTRRLKLLNDEEYDFVGIFDMEISMKDRLNIGRFGYIDIECEKRESEGKILKTRGHEFHYSEITENNEIVGDEDRGCTYFYNITKNDGRSWKCGYRKKSTLAGYPHISFLSNLEFYRYIVEYL